MIAVPHIKKVYMHPHTYTTYTERESYTIHIQYCTAASSVTNGPCPHGMQGAILVGQNRKSSNYSNGDTP